MPRHSWSPASRPSELRTERVCVKCGTLRVTRHDALGMTYPWTEYFGADGLLIEVGPGSGRTPKCEPAEVGAVA